jgi:hypothetical protein
VRDAYEDTQERTKIYSGSGHRSIIPYVHFSCIAPTGSWSTKLEEAREWDA